MCEVTEDTFKYHSLGELDGEWARSIRAAPPGYKVNILGSIRPVVRGILEDEEDIKRRLSYHRIDYMAMRYISGWVIYRYR